MPRMNFRVSAGRGALSPVEGECDGAGAPRSRRRRARRAADEPAVLAVAVAGPVEGAEEDERVPRFHGREAQTPVHGALVEELLDELALRRPAPSAGARAAAPPARRRLGLRRRRRRRLRVARRRRRRLAAGVAPGPPRAVGRLRRRRPAVEERVFELVELRLEGRGVLDERRDVGLGQLEERGRELGGARGPQRRDARVERRGEGAAPRELRGRRLRRQRRRRGRGDARDGLGRRRAARPGPRGRDVDVRGLQDRGEVAREHAGHGPRVEVRAAVPGYDGRGLGARAAPHGQRARPAVGEPRDVAPVPNSNLQPDFNVRVCDGFDAASLTWLRELDESNRFVQKSAESTSI